MWTRYRLVWFVGIVVVMVVLAACAPQAPSVAPTATPKPPAAAPTAAAKPAAAAPAPTTAPPVAAPTRAVPAAPAPTPAARPAAPALSPDFAALSAVIGVQSAQAYISGAGFHAMAEEIEKAKEIKPGYVNTVRNVLAVANAAPWPAELSKEQQTLAAGLKGLEGALAGNKVEEAAMGADAVHEAEHDLSKATFAWLKGQSKLGQASSMFKMQGDPNHVLGCTGVQSAQAYVSKAAFHAMAEDLEKTKEIKSSYINTVRNVMTVAGVVPWPTELTKEQGKLMADLKLLEAALAGNKVEDAAKGADAVHEAEHDFSKATFAWLGGHKHDYAAMMPMMGSDKLMQRTQATAVQSAQSYIGGAGFHAMEEDLGKTKEVKPSYLNTVRNVMTVANAVPWPTELSKEQGKLMAELKTLETALAGNKPEDAAKAADAVHGAEHDFSKATFTWLAGRKAG